MAATFFLVGLGPWVLGLWWLFGIGMVLAWDADGIVHPWFSPISLAVVVAWLALLEVTGRSDPWGAGWFAVATAVVILLLIRRGALARSPGTLLLHAGRLSYPLYLVHLPVITIVTGVAFKLWPDSLWTQLVALAVAAAVAIAAAELLHRLVEVPAITWSRRLRRAPQPAYGESMSN
jgi:peptidoglycan/LPS O-acetylase OafA/YrhL